MFYFAIVAAWLKQGGWIVVIGLVISGGLWGFAEVTDEVIEGETRHFDERVVEFMRNPEDPEIAWGPYWLQKTGSNISALGGIPVLSLGTLMIVGFLLLRRRYAEVYLLIAGIVGAFVLNILLNYIVGRE